MAELKTLKMNVVIDGEQRDVTYDNFQDATAREAAKPFVIEVTKSGKNYTIDKEYAEIVEAFENGKTLICKKDAIYIPLRYVAIGGFTFVHTDCWTKDEITIIDVDGELHVNVFEQSPTITIDGNEWCEDEPNMDFTDIINDMIDAKIAAAIAELNA